MSNNNALNSSRAEFGDEEFQHLVENHRSEIQFHCYRMLGSIHDAEDLAQETFVRAWRGRNQFEGRGSVRSWLYRIATNTCLNELGKRNACRRVFPEAESPPSVGPTNNPPATEINWLEPYPDSALAGMADPAPGPGVKYEMRETVKLAFMVAIQYLPPRQRAVLLLRDALGWSAEETANALETSVASANSALQRARATLATRLPRDLAAKPSASNAAEQSLLEKYIQAWEGADLTGLASLLSKDAILNMPPQRDWYQGRGAIQAVLAHAWSECVAPPFRLVRTSANRQPAFAVCSRGPESQEFKALAINIIEIHRQSIKRMNLFFDSSLFAHFGLPFALTGPERIVL